MFIRYIMCAIVAAGAGSVTSVSNRMCILPPRASPPKTVAALDAQEPRAQQPTQELIIKRTFHIAGVPGLRRNARCDLVLGPESISIKQGKRRRLELPIDRIRKAQLFSGERHYPGATYGAALATFGVGALLILKKHHVDTLVLDYANEAGGLMGLVIQVDKGHGAECREWLTKYGVTVEEPPPVLDLPQKER